MHLVGKEIRSNWCGNIRRSALILLTKPAVLPPRITADPASAINADRSRRVAVPAVLAAVSLSRTL
jgi:hypothetical protein